MIADEKKELEYVVKYGFVAKYKILSYLFPEVKNKVEENFRSYVTRKAQEEWMWMKNKQVKKEE